MIILKVLVGLFYGYIAFNGSFTPLLDTWQYHYESLKELEILKSAPSRFFTDIFYNPYQDGLDKWFSSYDSYWNDLRANLTIKVFAIFNLLTNSSYYTNVLLFTGLVIAGHVSFFRLFIQYFPGQRKIVLVGSFLIPTTLFWSSGIHKDGIIFLGIGLTLLAFNNLLIKPETGKRLKWLFYLVLGFIILFLLRNFLLAALIPALIAWYIASTRKSRINRVFVFSYMLILVLLVMVALLFPDYSLLKSIANKQYEFSLLEGGTNLPLKKLESTMVSFIEVLPQAIGNTLIRPFPWEIHKPVFALQMIETYFFLVLLFVFFSRKKILNGQKAIVCFSLFFVLTFFLMIGYTVPILGAISRYKALLLPLLFIPLVGGIAYHNAKANK